jgi:hypothetical protein
MSLKAVHAPLLATTAARIAYPLERIISEYLVSRGCSVVASILLLEIKNFQNDQNITTNYEHTISWSSNEMYNCDQVQFRVHIR